MSNDTEIQFRALKIFATVAASETLTQAAHKLGITQSAVSQAIAQLEITTASSLVVRRSRPIKLTPSGQVLEQHVQRVLADTRRMLAAVQSAADKGLSQLTLGLIDSFADAAAERLVEQVQPLANQISLHTGFNAPLTQAFLDRELDLLITTDPLDDQPELERHAVLRDPFVMLAAERHCGGRDVEPLQLAASLPFIRYTRTSRLGILAHLITRRLHVEPKPRFELDSTQTLLRFVQSGHGWAIATGLCISQYPTLLQGVRIMPLANSVNARYVSLLAPHDELGGIPSEVALMCRDICDKDVLPKLLALAPWLADHARTIEEVPII